MRLGGRLAAAIEVLGDIEQRKRPVADALKDWGLSHRFAGSGDRAAIGSIVYDALRMRLSHAFMMDGDTPERLAHAVLFRQWGVEPEALSAQLAQDRFAPEPLAAGALSALESGDLSQAPEHVQADIPAWTQDAFAATFGDAWLEQTHALTARPPLDLRVNALKATPHKVIRALARSGAAPAPLGRNALRIEAGTGPRRLPNVTAEPAFEKGWFEVQDCGSQAVSDLVMADAGEQVLDFCAGGGGKTLAMAAAMENRGQIHAFDADRRRLAPIIARLKRAGTRNVQIHEDRAGLDRLGARFDRVLVDAPCSGSGTWRRRPDTKWRLSESSLDERIGEQRAVLADAAAFVRPGGCLAYVTCSLMRQENEDRIAYFLAEHPDFDEAPAVEGWRTLFGDAAPKPFDSSAKTATLTPAATGTDGFFFALLRRRA